jgi:hypothetical protein
MCRSPWLTRTNLWRKRTNPRTGSERLNGSKVLALIPRWYLREAGGAYLVRPNFKAVLNLAAVLSLGSTSGLAANISLSPLDNDPAHAIPAAAEEGI